METIKKFLQDRGIRPSHHRIKVLQYLIRSPAHPSADQIFRGLIPTLPTITKATVYNALRLFVDKGIVSTFSPSGDEARFDYKHRLHAHFHCARCNKIIDIHTRYPCLDIQKIGPHKIQEIQLVFRGLCDECLKKGEKEYAPLRKTLKEKEPKRVKRPSK